MKRNFGKDRIIDGILIFVLLSEVAVAHAGKLVFVGLFMGDIKF